MSSDSDKVNGYSNWETYKMVLSVQNYEPYYRACRGKSALFIRNYFEHDGSSEVNWEEIAEVMADA